MGYFGEGQDVQFDGPVFPAKGRAPETGLAQLDDVYDMDADMTPVEPGEGELS